MPVRKSDAYRLHAEACEVAAERANLPDVKEQFRQLARQWNQRARQLDLLDGLPAAPDPPQRSKPMACSPDENDRGPGLMMPLSSSYSSSGFLRAMQLEAPYLGADGRGRASRVVGDGICRDGPSHHSFR